MVKVTLSAVLFVAFCSIAQAAPPAPGRQMAGPSAARTYWLSDGINRLVFWHPPATETVPADQPAH